ncbi:MAG: sialate O-acetylesterase [Planctomycetes bacterium]|nr:sialate O-acetylesterase [Planctomycetota bacterium]
MMKTSNQSSSARCAGNITRAALSVAMLVLLPDSVRADVKLPAIFSDHAVLQRDMPVPVWGWAEPGEEVMVAIAGQMHKTKADDKGKWRVTLEPLSVGAPLKMVVAGNNRLERNDILVGEVWLCSGQSNMEWPVSLSTNADLEIPAANQPRIRLVRVKNPGTQETVDDFQGGWEVCTPDAVKGFSAVGYYFGRELEQQIDVPVGLIDNSWGGSACDAWICRERMEGNPLYEAQLANWDKIAAEYEKDKDPKKAEQLAGNHRPGNLYHGRLEPVLGYAIRGAIWYQGESNAGRAYQYREMFPLMIQSWREDWKQGDFPFYWVQLADFMDEKTEPGDSAWAELREAQTMTQDRLLNTGQAVIIDIGEGSDIHPRNKLEVANRLARWALAKNYGRHIECQSPRYASMEAKDGKVTLKFKDTGGGLRPVDDKNVLGFAVAGEDRKWHSAEAKVTGPDTVELSSKDVPNPVAVRYAWADNPVCNLYNQVGLPVTPFRTDDWPGVTVDAR